LSKKIYALAKFVFVKIVLVILNGSHSKWIHCLEDIFNTDFNVRLYRTFLKFLQTFSEMFCAENLNY